MVGAAFPPQLRGLLAGAYSVRQQGPFTRADLMELGEFLGTADAVVSMREVLAGNREPRVVAVRHDVDNHPEALATAVELARWEASHGWRSTYFLLHTARYWRDGRWRQAAETMALLGHEIGLHVDAVAHALQHGGDPHQIVLDALEELRDAGHTVTGVVGHGNQLCHKASFANDEQFLECVRPSLGEPDRELNYNGRTLKLDSRPLADFGLQYEAISLRLYEAPDGVMRTRDGQVYNTDSGCKWYYPFAQTVAEFEAITDGQLHLLVHPDHWVGAFKQVAVAA
jgi:nucleotide-binding universal stress UspA family protein